MKTAAGTDPAGRTGKTLRMHRGLSDGAWAVPSQ